jgi:hypothetical protein
MRNKYTLIACIITLGALAWLVLTSCEKTATINSDAVQNYQK